MYALVKSKSTPTFQKNQTDDMSILSEVEYDEKDADSEKNGRFKPINKILKNVQLATYFASFGSIFYNKVPNIMNIISMQFKNGFSLSPYLLKRPVTQAIINSAMSIIPLSVILCSLFKKFNLTSEKQLLKPLQFFLNILTYLLIPYSIHYGESLGFYFKIFQKDSLIVLLSAVFSYLTFVASFLCFEDLKIINYNGKKAFYIFVQQYPTIIMLFYAICNGLKNKTQGVILFNTVFIVVSFFLIAFISKKCPFVETIWNIRSIATIASSLVFSIANFINYFFPDLTSWTINFAFVIVISITLVENGGLPQIVAVKRTKGRGKRQAYSEGLDDMPIEVKKRPLIKLMVQDYVCLTYFCSGVGFMTLLNAVVTRIMPVGKPLPDLIHSLFGDEIGYQIRAAPSFKKMQFSNLVCTLQIFSYFALDLVSPDTTNGRKVFLIYGTMAFIRMIAFWLTSMPAPCSGLPNCPCGDKDQLKAVSQYSPFMIAGKWIFGFGMYMNVPQCGDLIVSGHTMFMWLTFKWIMQTARRMVKRETADTVSYLCVLLFLLAISYITLARNHYTVDIFFGYLIAEGVFTAYDFYEKKIETQDNSFMVRLMRWIETREYPLIKRDFDEEIDVMTDFEA